ncbi:MAG: hypothetical protein IJ759_05945 [Bacteroidales bacterium]|nr:hypothetical protein [Bacteroidales bacterium]
MEAILKYGRMQCKGDVIKWTDKKTKEVITFVRRPYAKATQKQFQIAIIEHLSQIYRVKDRVINKTTISSRTRIKTWLKSHLFDIPSIVIYKEILALCAKYGFSQNEINKNQSLWIGKQWLKFFKDNNIRL